jgi:hypothetical protein
MTMWTCALCGFLGNTNALKFHKCNVATCENCERPIIGRVNETDDGYELCDECWREFQGETDK